MQSTLSDIMRLKLTDTVLANHVHLQKKLIATTLEQPQCPDRTLEPVM